MVKPKKFLKKEEHTSQSQENRGFVFDASPNMVALPQGKGFVKILTDFFAGDSLEKSRK